MASLSRSTSQESSASSQSLSAAAEGAAKAASSVEAAPTASSTRPVGPPRSRTSSHTLLHSSLNSHVPSRKSRFADAGTSEGNSGRASFSMPPPPIRPSSHKPAVGRQSSSGSTMDAGLGKGVVRTGSGSISNVLDRPTVIEDHDKTPNIQSYPASEPSSPLPPDNLKLPPSSATTDVEGNRSSFTSLYSLGSAIYQGTIGSHSAPPSAASSNAGSVKSGSFDPTSTPLSPTRASVRSDLSAPTTTATDLVLVTANTHTQLQGLQIACYFNIGLIDFLHDSTASQSQRWQVQGDSNNCAAFGAGRIWAVAQTATGTSSIS